MLWMNGPCADVSLTKGHLFFYEHPFNVGQHVAHNEMLDECVRRGVGWHIRVDDDCWITTKHWLRRLLAAQEKVKELTGKYAAFGITINGLNDPPPALNAINIGREIVENVPILGGIFRMTPMGLMRYFRWDERQAMGFGDATQFASYCESVDVPLFRVRGIKATHGDSTNKQKERDRDWDYQHDMLQYIPLGL